jgi:ubiquinol-cytochrome c reductase iron-sulfur subunit
VKRPYTRAAGISFSASILASFALTVVYWQGGHPQWEGVLLAVALGGLASGLIVAAKELMPGGRYVEQRVPHEPEAVQRALATSALERGEKEVGRRRFIGRMLAGALGALGIAALFPIRSLGTRPGRDLLRTSWTPGSRLVTSDGRPVAIDDLNAGGILTVFPEGAIDQADSQVVLVRLETEVVGQMTSREDWSPEGFIAYSKVCTHAGCPVGLYEPTSHELFCPCHQSAFDVLDGARPTAGPATRSLPQLPLEVDEAGYLVATADFSAPVGPGFWEL